MAPESDEAGWRGSPAAQPATRYVPDRARPRSLVTRLGKRGWAFVRTVVLVGLTGFLIAAVIATVFAGLIIAINGRLK